MSISMQIAPIDVWKVTYFGSVFHSGEGLLHCLVLSDWSWQSFKIIENSLLTSHFWPIATTTHSSGYKS